AMKPSDLGSNKTGMAASPIDSKRLLEEIERLPPPAGDGEGLAALRFEYISESLPIGSGPPPTVVHWAPKDPTQIFARDKPAVLLDKLGERLAFERTASRLYELLIGKVAALGSFPGGPSRERLIQIYDEEASHFELLRDIIESLGGDPTVQTPSADL